MVDFQLGKIEKHFSVSNTDILGRKRSEDENHRSSITPVLKLLYNWPHMRRTMHGDDHCSSMLNIINIWWLLCRIKEQVISARSQSDRNRIRSPFLYWGTFQVNDEPKDTFLNMENWTKGVCFINGHNLGRYWKTGPQGTLYLPAPWLQKGENEASRVTNIWR